MIQLFQITYDYLVVALGMELRFDKIKGLTDAIGKNGVCSNYGPGNISLYIIYSLNVKHV